MEGIVEKRNQYKRIKRKKQDIVISNEEMEVLKNENRIHNIFTKSKKRIQQLNNDLSNLLILIEDVCRNFKRKNPSGEHEDMAPYML